MYAGPSRLAAWEAVTVKEVYCALVIAGFTVGRLRSSFFIPHAFTHGIVSGTIEAKPALFSAYVIVPTLQACISGFGLSVDLGKVIIESVGGSCDSEA